MPQPPAQTDRADAGCPVDVVVLGGGVAGLWALDELVRAGYRCVLLESRALGHGQTVGSQGIIHGGLKYTLAGVLTRSAEHIREMPGLWRESLAGGVAAGRRGPDTSATRLRSDFCYLWRTGSLASRLGLVGARAGLRVKPVRLPRGQWPEVLGGAGEVFRLDEQVISPPSFLSALAAPHAGRMLRYDERTLTLDRDQRGRVRTLSVALDGQRLTLRPGAVVFTAGPGNAALRAMAGLTPPLMQRRGVHMILARGDRPGSLPGLNGHCVDGNKTRVTLTTDTDAQGRTVWQIGGQVSEDGTDLSRDALIALARREVSAALGGREFPGVSWGTYQLDKAEVVTPGGLRPDDAFVQRTGNVVTCWPTKLALAPRLAERVLGQLDPPATAAAGGHPDAWPRWPRPAVADPPWDDPAVWTTVPPAPPPPPQARPRSAPCSAAPSAAPS